MKNFIKDTLLQSLLAGLIFCLPLLGGCHKNNLEDDTNTIPLSEIPENPDYTKLPLTGTNWILIGFANAKTGKIRKVEHPDYDQGDYYLHGDIKLYTLVFTEEGKLHGKASINMVGGSYMLDKDDGQKFTDVVLLSYTYAGENPDGGLYIDAINQAIRFSIGAKGLSLYYDSDSYLLFKPLEE